MQEVYVGRGPLRLYITKAHFSIKENGEVLIYARGALISKMLLITKMLSDTGYQYQLGTLDFEDRQTEDGRTKTVPRLSVRIFK
jgi:DNA-binding protein